MTGKDLMYFGKHKGLPLWQVPYGYYLWLREQEWFKKSEKPKDKELAAYIEEREMDEFVQNAIQKLKYRRQTYYGGFARGHRK